MKSICFFNNKGGVGKTTLTCNVAYALAKEHGLRVAVVDCDPQCNATILILGEENSIPIYWQSDEQSTNHSHETLADLLSPLELGDSSIKSTITLVNKNENRFLVDLLPGHPRMSIIEDRLSQAWRDTSSGIIEGVRRTNWVHSLNKQLESHYDVVLYDLGPSLGALNRSCLLGSDYFLTPMGADIFSMIGLRNIAEWLTTWNGVYETGVKLCENQFKGAIDKFGLLKELKINNGYIGYTVLSYIAKYKQGEKRPTQAFETLLTKFPLEVLANLGQYAVDSQDLRIGDIPNMYSLAPLAQSNASPIGGLNASDGLVGAHFAASKNIHQTFVDIATKIKLSIGL
nr:AAA family ATPase [uncultured Chitinophaga sp.]